MLKPFCRFFSFLTIMTSWYSLISMLSIGMYSDSPGSSSCSECPVGKNCSNPSQTPTDCPAGTYSAVNTTACTPCVAGHYSTAGSGSCTVCPAGKNCSSSDGVPSNCPEMMYSTEGSSGCTACRAGVNWFWGKDLHNNFLLLSFPWHFFSSCNVFLIEILSEFPLSWHRILQHSRLWKLYNLSIREVLSISHP